MESDSEPFARRTINVPGIHQAGRQPRLRGRHGGPGSAASSTATPPVAKPAPIVPSAKALDKGNSERGSIPSYSRLALVNGKSFHIKTKERRAAEAPPGEPATSKHTNAARAFQNVGQNSRALDLLHRYETSYSRVYTRSPTNAPPNRRPKTRAPTENM